jgi:hypothetical protein
LGAEYNGPHEEALTEITPRELAISIPLCVLAVILGVFPAVLFRYMDPTIDRQVAELGEWTERVKLPALQAERQAAEEADVALLPQDNPAVLAVSLERPRFDPMAEVATADKLNDGSDDNSGAMVASREND